MIEKDLLENTQNPVFKIGEDKVTIYDPNSLWDSVKSIIEQNNNNDSNQQQNTRETSPEAEEKDTKINNK